MSDKTKVFRINIFNSQEPDEQQGRNFCINSTEQAAKANICAWLEAVFFRTGKRVPERDVIYDKIQGVIYHCETPVNVIKFQVIEEYI
jgi:hypothetical protein